MAAHRARRGSRRLGPRRAPRARGGARLAIPRKPEVWLHAISARLREGSLDEWLEMLSIVERSPHLCGENDRGWKADLGWLSKRENYAKVLNGNYLRTRPKPQKLTRY